MHVLEYTKERRREGLAIKGNAKKKEIILVAQVMFVLEDEKSNAKSTQSEIYSQSCVW